MPEKLKIDRSKIRTEIINKCMQEGYENYKVDKLKSIDGKRHRIDIKVEEIQFFIDFFFNKDYTTTIQANQGKNIDIKMKFVDYLSNDENLKTAEFEKVNRDFENEFDSTNKSNDTIVYKYLKKDIFDDLLECLEANDIYNDTSYVRDEKDQKICKIVDKQGNEVTITYYIKDKGYTIMIQGKPKMLFGICVAEIADMIDREENIAALNEFYGTETTLDDIEKQFESMFVNSKSYMSDKIKKSVCQALQNRRDLEEKFDPSYLAYPSIRAVEGHLRYVCGGLFTGTSFDFFKVTARDRFNNPIKYELKKKYYNYFGNDSKKIDIIGRTYTYMALYRNKLFHWDNPNPFGIDTTKVLSSSEVDKTIMDGLKLIEEYYS